MNNFVHLHTHSHYSLLDASATIDQLVKKASKLKMKSLALTDHGNLFGAMEFYNKAKANKIKPIIGCELYISVGPHKIKKRKQGEKHYHHLIVLAKNNEGYKNLIKIASISYTEGFYYRPRVDKKTLFQNCQGLIASSACLAGEIPQSIIKKDLKKTKNLIEEFQEGFGIDNFFLELQDHGIELQKIANKEIIKLSDKLKVPLIATNDVHYINQEDYKSHDALLCIASQNKISDEKRKRYHKDQFYLKSIEEIEKVFPENKEAIQNTNQVAKMCNVNLDFKSQLPNIKLPSNEKPNDYLNKLCQKGIKKIYKNPNKEIKDRLNYELKTISKMGLSSYFLIVNDFINYAKLEKIAVGPGRGSVAGSLVAYALNITNVDPIKYSLLFERFLNPNRISMPDIDTDFQDDKRDKVIQYVINKYGQDKVANIITFGKLKARAVIRDIGRVLDIPLPEVDKIAKLIPLGPKANLKDTYEKVKDFKKIIDGNKTYKNLLELSLKLEGVIRNASTHAAGIIIGRDKLLESIPLYCDSKTGQISTQYEGAQLEKCGLLKMDFLGLKNLSIIQKCLEILSHRNIKIDINNIPMDNKKTYKLLQSGFALGIFQLESSGMQELMRQLKPYFFEEIVALIALYRPGPLNSGMATEFVKRKHNASKIKYPHPKLEKLLKETYGVIVYQEQVMEIARIIAGFSMAQADELRKAMGKKLKNKMEELKRNFIEGAVKNNIDSSLADLLYRQMETFGEYGFNKSHSVAYALITYQTAYLKANYPVEYMAGLLSCEKDNIDRIVGCIKEAKRMGIEILSPCVNKSNVDFSIENGGIRFGLSAIKNVGQNKMEMLIEKRSGHGKFEDVLDLCKNTDNIINNRKTLEFLIKSGACDDFGNTRSSLFNELDRILEWSQEINKENESSQISLFENDLDFNKNSNIKITKIKEWPDSEKLKYEKESLGFYFSGNPMLKYQDKINKMGLENLDIIRTFEKGSKIAICGILVDIQFKISKKGSDWAIAIFDLVEIQFEVLFFNKSYKKAKDIAEVDKILYIEGKVESNDNKLKIIADNIISIENISDNYNFSVFNNLAKSNKNEILQKENKLNEKVIKNIQLKENSKTKKLEKKELKVLNLEININEIDKMINSLDNLKNIIKNHSGNSEIIMHFKSDKQYIIKANPKFNINASEKIIKKIKDLPYIYKVWLD